MDSRTWRTIQKIKHSLAHNAELAIPNTSHPFFITVVASLLGLGAVLFQPNSQNKRELMRFLFQPNLQNKMQFISYNSRILNTQEQKLSTYDRELCAVIFALQVYEFLFIGSKFPITLSTDHNLFFYFHS